MYEEDEGIYEEARKFINSIIPTTDPNHAIKRLRFKDWYKPFGEKVLAKVDLVDVTKDLTNISDDKYWIYTEHGDILLNRIAFLEDILNLRSTSNDYVVNEYNRYEASCWLCIEKNIRQIFPLLNGYKDESESEREFVSITLSRYSSLMSFWSHYIHIIDENGKYIKNPNVGIICNLRRLMKDKGLGRINQANLWKYGFECAKKEGCIEGLQFFLIKLKEAKVSENEIDRILIDLTSYASSAVYPSLIHSRPEVIGFCLDQLGYNKHRTSLHNFEFILHKMKRAYLFGYVKEIIRCLGQKNITHEKYHSIIYGTGDQIGHQSNKELRKMGTDFLMWMLSEENFSTHKKSFLREINYNNPGLIRVLTALIMRGEVEPFERILEHASGKNLKKIGKLLGGRALLYCPLYLQGRQDILSKMLNSDERAKEFFEGMDELMVQDPQLKKDLHDFADNAEDLEAVILQSELLVNLNIKKIIKRKFKPIKQGENVLSALSDLNINPSISNSLLK